MSGGITSNCTTGDCAGPPETQMPTTMMVKITITLAMLLNRYIPCASPESAGR